MRKAIIVTIHGVNPSRKWQSDVGRVLAPHFECMHFEYRAYDTILGPIRAVIHIQMAVLATTLLTLAGIPLWGEGRLWATSCLIAAFASFVIGIALARRQREAHVLKIKGMLDKIGSYSRPHVIAHSLGTYLIGHALRKFVDLRLGNVLLVSSVLPRQYPWQKILSTRQNCVESVRNEFGRSDLVTRMVGWFQWLLRGMGSSGAMGFHEVAGVVQNARGPYPIWRAEQDAMGVMVHNVPLAEYGHSTTFLSPAHARQLWLPYFWGFEAGEFLGYLDNCQKAHRLQQEHRWHDLDLKISHIWNKSYGWTHGMPLIDSIREHIAARAKYLKHPLSNLDDIVKEVQSVLHIFTAEACSEVDKSGEIDENVARGLHPSIAITRAVEHVVR